jgi:ferric-dicitrate binding protein FerR (iron transport regulator)
MTGPDNLLPPDDADEARILREGLKTSPLSAEALKRIRAATEAEWRATVAVRRRRWAPMSIAASVLGITLVAGLSIIGTFGSDGDGEVLANLVRSESPGMLQVRALRSDARVEVGEVLRSDRTYEARGQALLALESGGNLRVAAGSSIEVVAKDAVRLDAGQLYVDIPPGSRASSAFVVMTPAGEFRHVGTQFALAVAHGETRLRVREGQVRWLKADGESYVEAGTDIHISRDGEVSRRVITPSDAAWDWIAATTPDFEVANRPLQEFLAWVARESGRELVLADEATHRQVATIRMHGSVNGLTPLQALSAVMAATSLRYELSEGQIRVSFEGDPSIAR